MQRKNREKFYWAVFEYYPSEKGDAKRLVWKFDDKESCQNLINIIRLNDVNWSFLEIEKIEV